MKLKGKRVFIIEDNASNLAIMSVYLRKEGASVEFERWGYNTCDTLRKAAPIDVILLDLMFPRNVTGYQIFEKIRSMPDFRHVPVIAVTAADPETEMVKVRQTGFSGFISKPIMPTFPYQIEMVLAGKPVWAINAEL